MKIVNGFDLMDYAQKRNVMLPAFNTTNLEMTKAIIQGLNSVHMPGMIQISSNNLHLSDPETIAFLVNKFLKGTDTPIGLHLDHGKSFEDVKACVDAGFTSIMVDASDQDFEGNIAEVKRTVEYCHFYNIPVEAELGAIMGKEDDHVSEADCHTDPALVREFVERSGCDLLAVSIGNVHGFDVKPKVDLDLLKKIAEVSPVPLVLHGGSGIPFEQVKAMKQYKMLKINYGSDLRSAYIKTFGEAYEKNHKEANLFGLCKKAVENVAKTASDLVLIINDMK
ncbi:class II aldolase [Faecalicoccus pleomorphus]|uniref:Class II aldolase n=1 Tax=Faecalicoccus pleomorphus TaxID=1323 RepID=A0A7X9RHN4_9FIRM|nr:class II aldolase [Faecalicoccus pleomorphus]NME45100.1 class II aldolase [Faecalicoccus pleomorphus]